MITPEVFYNQVAVEYNLSPELVKKVNNFFWKEGVKYSLSNVKHTSVFIKNIGTIVISKYKLNKELSLLIKKMRNIKNSNKYTEKRKNSILEGYKINFRKLWTKRNEIIKENYFEHGYNY